MANGLQDRLAIVQALIREFRAERVAYLCLSIVGVAVLLTASIYGFMKSQFSIAEFVALCGSGGAMTGAVAGLLKMWRDALAFIARST